MIFFKSLSFVINLDPWGLCNLWCLLLYLGSCIGRLGSKTGWRGARLGCAHISFWILQLTCALSEEKCSETRARRTLAWPWFLPAQAFPRCLTWLFVFIIVSFGKIESQQFLYSCFNLGWRLLLWLLSVPFANVSYVFGIRFGINAKKKFVENRVKR